MKWYEKTAMILAAVGAINWGLVAMNFNLVNFLVGSWPIVERIVYGLVGISGIYAIIAALK